MPTTTPDGIYFADSSTAMSAEAISAAEATSVQDALDTLINDARQIQTFVWADSAARTAQAGMSEGDEGYQLDTNVAYRYDGSTWNIIYTAGLVPIIPASVAGTGVTLNSVTGMVTFSASSAVRVNGCFTSAFRHYMCIATVSSRSTNSFSRLYLRASGTDLVTGYDIVRTIYGATVTIAQLANNTDIPMGSTNAASQNYTIDFRQPQLSAQSGYNTKTVEVAAAAVPTAITSDGSTRSTSAYDGFTMDAAAGNMTGTLKVYGYN